ncbi:MAG TPA: hypothetical protein VK603_10725 [Candidatus Saccharimonadales bacterium]|nr:hypothetical protein [Candidatus Saccharimonadales bacterium]
MFGASSRSLYTAWEGTFSGQTLHARDFKRAEPIRGKRVLVVGGGNSGCDIAVDIGRVTLQTCLSMRRGYHFVPKLMFGRPRDVLYHRVRRLGFPKSWTRYAAEACVRFNVGPPEKYGLQPPDARLFEMLPTLSSDILSALRDGRVFPRAGIERLNGAEVRFSDGRSESFDVNIWATGYRERFPFLDSSVVDWKPGDQPSLLLKMMHQRIPNLFFIGLFQPIGCIWRLADYRPESRACRSPGSFSGRSTSMPGSPISWARRIGISTKRHVMHLRSITTIFAPNCAKNWETSADRHQAIIGVETSGKLARLCASFAEYRMGANER